jgi:coenzyme F420-0:L-glutamate ligase/coenzyme F420-1:gamma-L-glutamate ligase
MSPQVTLTAVPDIPHVQPGDSIAQLVLTAISQSNIDIRDGDILAVAQKIVSKAEGRLVDLADVMPGETAVQLAAQTEKDPRLVELVLQESDEVSRWRKGVLIVRHRLGFTCANAGIDRSNVAQHDQKEEVLLLPRDPDASAEQLRQAIRHHLGVKVGVIITDSHGRPFRVGTVGVAIGVAGFSPVWDRRGETDLYGYTLQHTDVAIADEIAAAASLLMGQAAEGMPVILIRGLRLPQGSGKATDVIRPKELDLYR